MSGGGSPVELIENFHLEIDFPQNFYFGNLFHLQNWKTIDREIVFDIFYLKVVDLVNNEIDWRLKIVF